MTKNHIRQTFGKSFADFANTVCSVTRSNVNSIQTPLNISATSFHRVVSEWHQTKSTLSLNGLHLAKSKTFNLSSVSATSIDDLYSTIQKLLFHLHDSLKKMLCGSGHHNANSLLICSSKLSLKLLFFHIGFQTDNLLSKQMLPIMHWQLSSLLF